MEVAGPCGVCIIMFKLSKVVVSSIFDCTRACVPIRNKPLSFSPPRLSDLKVHTYTPRGTQTCAAIHPRRLYFCTCTVPKRDNPNSAARRRRRKQPEPCAYSRQHSFWPARLPWPSLLVLVLSRARMPQHSSLPPRAELRRGRDETRTPSCGITPAGKTAPPLISSPALSLSLDIPSSHFTIEPIGLREPKTAAGRKGRAGGRAWWLPPAGCATRRISLLSLH